MSSVMPSVVVWVEAGDGSTTPRDLSLYVTELTFRRATGPGQFFRVGLKVPWADPVNDDLAVLRDFSWVRIGLTLGDGSEIVYLGVVQTVRFRTVVAGSGVEQVTWEISGVSWADLVLNTAVREPLTGERLPGFLPIGDWVAKFGRLAGQHLERGDITSLLKATISEMLWGLYPFEGKPLIEHIDWSRAEPVHGVGVSFLGMALSVSIQVQQVVDALISPDLAEFFGDYSKEGDKPAFVLRHHPLLIWGSLPQEDVTKVVVSLALERPGGPRGTVWFPGSVGSALYQSRVSLSYSGDVMLPIADAPLLARFGYRPRALRDPAYPITANKRDALKRLFLNVTRRTVAFRRVGITQTETWRGTMEIKATKAIVPGMRVAFGAPRALGFWALGPKYKQGQEDWTLTQTGVLVGYVTGCEYSAVVLGSGVVQGRITLELDYVQPSTGVGVPPLPPQPRPKVQVQSQKKDEWIDNETFIIWGGQKVDIGVPVSVLAEESAKDLGRAKQAGVEYQGAVVHHTGTGSLSGTMETFRARGTSAHFIVTDDRVYQLFDPAKWRAYHAKSFNKYGVGIDFLGGPAELGGGGVELTTAQVQKVVSLLKALANDARIKPLAGLSTAQWTYPYRKPGVTLLDWRAAQGIGIPLKEVPGVFAHNQLDATRWDPTQPGATSDAAAEFWDNVLRQSLATPEA